MWKKGNTCALLIGMKIGTATMENSIEAPQKIKNMIQQFYFCVYMQRK